MRQELYSTTQPNGYTSDVRRKDIKLYLKGNRFRGVDRLLKVNHHSVANWVKEYAEQLPKAKVPQNPKVAELDELFTFIGRKKTKST
jgi:transposase-like protein